MPQRRDQVLFDDHLVRLSGAVALVVGLSFEPPQRELSKRHLVVGGVSALFDLLDPLTQVLVRLFPPVDPLPFLLAPACDRIDADVVHHVIDAFDNGAILALGRPDVPLHESSPPITGVLSQRCRSRTCSLDACLRPQLA